MAPGVQAAISLTEQIEKYGAYAGLAAVVGLAVLSLLYFAQAREVRRLREWAGRAPERAAELEARVTDEAQRRTEVQAPAGAGASVRPEAPSAVPAVASAAVPATAAAAQGAGRPAAVAVSRGGLSAAQPMRAPGAAGATAQPMRAPGAAGATASAAPAADAPPTGTNGSAPPAGAAPPPEVTPGQAGPAPKLGPVSAAAAARAGVSPAAGAGGRPPAGRVAPVRRLSPPAPPVTAPPRGRRGVGGHRARTVVVLALGVLVIAAAAIILATQLGGDDPAPPATRPATAAGNGAGADGAGSNSGGGSTERGETTVAVLNGTSVVGLASRVANELNRAGFAKGQVTNARDNVRSATTVSFRDGRRAQAAEVAELVGVGPDAIQPMDPDTAVLAGPQADVVVTVGSDRTTP